MPRTPLRELSKDSRLDLMLQASERLQPVCIRDEEKSFQCRAHYKDVPYCPKSAAQIRRRLSSRTTNGWYTSCCGAADNHSRFVSIVSQTAPNEKCRASPQ